jgi:hypothetical protein
VKATYAWDCRHDECFYTSDLAAAETAIHKQLPAASIEKIAYTETIENFKQRVDRTVSAHYDSTICVIPVEVMARVAARLRRKGIPVIVTQGRAVEMCVSLTEVEMDCIREGVSLWEAENRLFLQSILSNWEETVISYDPVKGLLIDQNTPKAVVKSAAKALLTALETAINTKLKELKHRPVFHSRSLSSLVSLWKDLELQLNNIMALYGAAAARDISSISNSLSKLTATQQAVNAGKQNLPTKGTCQSLFSAIETAQLELKAWRQEVSQGNEEVQRRIELTCNRISAVDEALQAKLQHEDYVSIRLRSVEDSSIELDINSSIDVENASLVTALAPDYTHICLEYLQISKGVHKVLVHRCRTGPAQTYVVTQGNKWISNLLVVSTFSNSTPQ